MKWEPVLNEEEERQVQTGYISDNTSFLRMQTEIEKKDRLIDDDFLDRHKARVIACDKFAPLANTTSKSQIMIDRIRRIIMDLEKEAGLFEDAEATALDNIADYQVSRGYNASFQNALITQRHIIKQSTDQEGRLGRFSKLFRKPKEPEGEVPE